jgi:predicted O-linked N-acetylglucosamine transferase (SPINDLY family)
VHWPLGGYFATFGDKESVQYLLCENSMLHENETQYFTEQPVYLLPSFYGYYPPPSSAAEARTIRAMVEKALDAATPFPSLASAERSPAHAFPSLPAVPISIPFELQLPDRKALGLPPKEDGTFIFFNFAEPYKVDRQVFATWMQILNVTQNTVLLLPSGATNERNQNMKKYMSARGIDPKRLIFTTINGVPWQLTSMTDTRHILSFVDLYLDTFPFGTDVLSLVETLYHEVPVLALQGRSFSEMVGTSFLKTLGLPELIAQSKTKYVATAARLVRSTREDPTAWPASEDLASAVSD